jgi:short-chain Z-isoprenyl diphosphate synthase
MERVVLIGLGRYRRSVRMHRPNTAEIRRLPVHVGVVMDGNRRWARAVGHVNPSVGHKHGAEHVEQLLDWCTAWGIDHVTTYALSADNIRKRSSTEIDYVFELLTDTVPRLVLQSSRWALHISGDMEMVPTSASRALAEVQEATSDRPAHLTMAIGYDGRQDIVAGIRRALATHGPDIDANAITASLPGGPVKEIDLVIRTSGEFRLSGFFPWQTANAEIFVSPKMWPAFTGDDFTDALRYYADHAR